MSDRHLREMSSDPPKLEPPVVIVPTAPCTPETAGVTLYHIRVTWEAAGAPAGAAGHVYVVDAMLAAIASSRVAEGLADATLAGLCFRCTPSEDAERLIRLHVLPAVLEAADEMTWQHAPTAGLHCGGCE